MKIRVLVDGKFNNKEHKSKKCKKGTVLETSDAYGNLLVADGLAVNIGKPVKVKINNPKPKIVKLTDETLDGKKPATPGNAAAKKNEFVE
jgi:hypothetical protein